MCGVLHLIFFAAVHSSNRIQVLPVLLVDGKLFPLPGSIAELVLSYLTGTLMHIAYVCMILNEMLNAYIPSNSIGNDPSA